jgi:hypothetical protein
MFKIIIVAYIFGTMPIDTVQEFEMSKSYKTMDECKQELLLQSKPGYYDVTTEFIMQFQGKYDWVAAGCVNPATKEEYRIFPEYDEGEAPEGLDQLGIRPGMDV